MEAAIRAGDKKLADKVSAALKKDLNEQMAYYAYLGDMGVAELQQAVQDLLANKADNLSNNQRQMFQEIRQAVLLLEYIRSLEAMK